MTEFRAAVNLRCPRGHRLGRDARGVARVRLGAEKASWQRIMAGLDKHFGEDVDLDPSMQAVILRLLAGRTPTRRQAGSHASGDDPGAAAHQRHRPTALRYRATRPRTPFGSPAHCAERRPPGGAG
ncbi:MAG: hypothetical protein ACLGG4_01425 [Gammaproteobacteria bacterium]